VEISELNFVLDTLLDVQCELEELEKTNDWFITQCGEKLESAIEIITTSLLKEKIKRDRIITGIPPKDDELLRSTLCDVVSKTRKGTGAGPRC